MKKKRNSETGLQTKPITEAFYNDMSNETLLRIDILLLDRGLAAGLECVGDVGDDAAVDDDLVSEELVELGVVVDGEEDVARDDAGLVAVVGDVAGQLQHLGHEVLEQPREEHGRGAAHARRRRLGALAHVAVDAAHREHQVGLLRARHLPHPPAARRHGVCARRWCAALVLSGYAYDESIVLSRASVDVSNFLTSLTNSHAET